MSDDLSQKRAACQRRNNPDNEGFVPAMAIHSKREIPATRTQPPLGAHRRATVVVD
jgi:hypothetical protein